MMTRKIGLNLVLVFLFTVSSSANAEIYAKVLKSKNMNQYRQGQELVIGSEITTGENQKLAIRTIDGDVIVLDSKTRITLSKPSLIEQLFGTVYFLFKPRPENPVQVKTLTATIGIRGTNFLLATDNEKLADLISLEKGLLNVESPDDQPFKIHNQNPLSEFEQYKLEAQQSTEKINEEFEEYKKQVNQEFVEYKLSVELSAGKTLKLLGHDLHIVDLPDDQQNEIDLFKDFLAGVTE